MTANGRHPHPPMQQPPPPQQGPSVTIPPPGTDGQFMFGPIPPFLPQAPGGEFVLAISTPAGQLAVRIPTEQLEKLGSDMYNAARKAKSGLVLPDGLEQRMGPPPARHDMPEQDGDGR